MGKDFVNTQTGGEGVTSQMADVTSEDNNAQIADRNKPKAKAKAIKKQNRKDDREDKRNARKDRRKGGNDSEVVDNEPVEEPVIAESENEPVEEPTPLIAPIGEPVDVSKNVDNFSFNVPTEEEAEAEDSRIGSGFNFHVSSKSEDIEGEDLLSLPEGVEPFEPAEKVYNYPGRDTQYVIRDNKWYSKEPKDNDYTEVSGNDARRRYLGLNSDAIDSEGNKAPKLKLPENNYKPPVGGQDVDGVKIYGYPSRPGWAYTVKDGEWHSLDPKTKKWSKIESDDRIGALNDYHGTKILTESEKKEEIKKMSAQSYPSTEGKGDIAGVDFAAPHQLILKPNGELGRYVNDYNEEGKIVRVFRKQEMSDDDIQMGIEAGAIFDEYSSNVKKVEEGKDPIKSSKEERLLEQESIDAKAEGDMATKAGKALEERQAGFVETFTDLEFDENGNPLKTTGALDLFGAPNRPQSDFQTFGQDPETIQWDANHGQDQLLNSVSLSNSIEDAKKYKQSLIDELYSQIRDFSYKSEDGDIVVNDDAPDWVNNHFNDYSKLIDSTDLNIESLENSKSIVDESASNYEKYKNDYSDVLTSDEILEKAFVGNYGMYQDNAGELIDEAYKDFYKAKASENKVKLENFVNRDIDEWGEYLNLTDNQKAQLKMMQEQAKFDLDLSSTLHHNRTEEQVNDFLESSFNFQNTMAEAYNLGQDLTDYLLVDRKIAFEEAKANGLISQEVEDLFNATIWLRDFMSPYIEDGKIIVDEISGRYDISDNVSGSERALLESNLNAYLENYNSTKSKIYNNNQSVINSKTKELKSKEAAILSIQRDVKSGKTKMTENIKTQIDNYNRDIEELKSNISDLKGSNNVTFQTNPNSIASDMSGFVSDSSRMILKALPDNVTGYQKFALFYDELKKKTKSLGDKYNIGQSYLDRVGDKAKDVLDIDFLNMSLSPQEVEYYKNQALLSKALPLYLNNDWGVTEESAGFWDSFWNSFVGTFAPVTSGAYGYYTDTQSIAGHMKMMEQMPGFSESDLVSGTTVDKMLDRMDIDFMSFETFGGMTGTSVAIMTALVGTGGVTSGGVKAGKGMYRLMNHYKSLDRITDAAKDLKRVNDAYQNTMNASRTGRFLMTAVDHGVQFEAAGLLTNMDDELNFSSGLFGSMGGQTAGLLLGKITPSAGVSLIAGIFGKKAPKAVEVLKNLGQTKWATTARAAHYRGIGEIPEEFAQELTSIYRDVLRERGFYEEVYERYIGEDGGNISNLEELAFASYLLGAGMGTSMSTTQQDYLESIPPNRRNAFEKEIKAAYKDIASANTNADIAAEKIANDYDDAINGLVAPERNKGSKTENKPSEEGVEGDVEKKLPIYDDQGNITGYRTVKREKSDADVDKSPNKTSKFQDFIAKAKEEGLTLEEASIKAEQEGTFDDDIDFQAKLKEAKNKGLTMDEFVSQQEESTKEKSLADKIREQKININENTYVTIPGLPQAWNAAVEGVAVTVENVNSIINKVQKSDWYKGLSSDDKNKVNNELNKIAEDLVETNTKHKQPKNPTESYQAIKNKISQFKKGYVEGEKAGKRLTKSELSEKNKVIESIQDDLVKYAKENLPKKSYSKSKLIELVNKVKRARSMVGLDKAITAIDKEVVKFQEEIRLNTVDKVLSTFNDPLTKKRGSKKVSKISVDSRKEMKTLGEEIGLDNVENMSQEELDVLDERIDNILTQGASSIKQKEFDKSQNRREQRAVPFKVLSTQNNKKKFKLSGDRDIREFFKSKQGSILYDNQQFSGYESFNKYLESKGTNIESVGELEATLSSTNTSEASQGYKDKVPTIKRVRKSIADTISSASSTLENRLEHVYRGSKELRVWVDKNIVETKNEAYFNKANELKKKRDFLQSGVKEIFGTNINKIPKGWNDSSGVTIKAESKELTKGQLVNAYMMSKSGARMIYNVGTELFDSKSQADKYAENSGQTVEEYTDSYNPDVLRKMSPDAKLGIEAINKISEINDRVESDNQLSDVVKLLREAFDSYKSDYEPIFEEMYDLQFKEGDTYFPLTRSNPNELDSDLLSSDKFNNASSAMSSHLKQRHHSTGNVEFDFQVDALTKTLRYIKEMEHAKQFLPVAESFRNLMNPATKAQIIEKIGVKRTNNLEAHINRVINDGDVSTGNYEKLVNSIAGYTVVTTLAFRLGSIPKQLTSATHYLGAGWEDGVGVHKVLNHTARILDEAGSNLTDNEIEVLKEVITGAFTTDRVKGSDIDTETKRVMDDMMKSKGQNFMRDFTRVILSPTVIGDIGGVLMGGMPFTLATYNNNINNKGMSHEEAMNDALKKFVTVSNKTQQSQREDIISNTQKNPAYRLFLQYTTSQVAAMSEMRKGLKVIRATMTGNKDEYSPREIGSAIMKTLYYSIANAPFQIVSSGTLGMYMAGLEEDDDDTLEDKQRKEDLRKTAVVDLIMDTAQSNLQGAGIPGKFVDWLMNQGRGRGVFNNIPVVQRMVLAVDAGSDYLPLWYDVAGLYFNPENPEDEITFDEAMLAMSGYYDRDEKSLEGVAELFGVKNIMKTYEAYEQWFNENDDKDLSGWDAFMGRTISDESEDVYRTGRERAEMSKGKDENAWIYEILFPETYTNEGAWMPDEQRSEMEERANLLRDNSEMSKFGGVSDEDFAEKMSESSPGEKEFTSKEEEWERKKRSKGEILQRIMEMRTEVEAAKKEAEWLEPDKNNEDLDVDSTEDKIKEFRRIQAEEYNAQFGNYPPEKWDGYKIKEEINKRKN